MYVNNQGAPVLVKSPHLQERSKHIDINYNLINDSAEKKEFDIDHVPTSEMTADGMKIASTTHLRKNLGNNSAWETELGHRSCYEGKYSNSPGQIVQSDHFLAFVSANITVLVL